jgi:hypothetical protein
VFSGDADVELRRLVDQEDFAHRESARHAQRFRATGDVAHLVDLLDDPRPCSSVERVFALAVYKHLWLNRVPMPTEVSCASANQIAEWRARGEVDARNTWLLGESHGGQRTRGVAGTKFA